MSRSLAIVPWWFRLLWGSQAAPVTFSFASWLFLRALGVIYLVAFWSLATQIVGLVGERGILPARLFLETMSQRVGPERFWFIPTVFWFNAGDSFLQGLTVAGAALSVGLILGLFEVPLLCLLWVLYLSLFTVGGPFLSFQWDVLLLETGFLAIFLAPVSSIWLPRAGAFSPPKLVHWLFCWLLFRLVFSSGVVKLTSGDVAWRGFTALNYHYETQPLPTRAAWYFHQLPAGFQEFSVFAMFFFELVIPFLVFGPRNLRLLAGTIIAFFQVMIFITGNYCFFNLLALALCLLLVDDSSWPKRWRLPEGATEDKALKAWPRWVQAPLAVFILLLSLIKLPDLFRIRIPWPDFVVQTIRAAEPLHIVNSYGLFAVMTTNRREIIVEGSRDGKTWHPYEFKYKPGDLKRAPMQVAPHQPRLDWQMWFAALGIYQDNRWFINFAIRLLQGSPEVIKLLRTNPFGNDPPRYIRATLYDYHFTDPETLKREGTWWRRESLGPYAPVFFLKEEKS